MDTSLILEQLARLDKAHQTSLIDGYTPVTHGENDTVASLLLELKAISDDVFTIFAGCESMIDVELRADEIGHHLRDTLSRLFSVHGLPPLAHWKDADSEIQTLPPFNSLWEPRP